MPATVIAGNWKMNTTLEEARSLAQDIRDRAGQVSGVDLILCPPAISLAGVKHSLAGSPVKVGAQNMHQMDSGAFTGEIAPTMLIGICEYVIIGHSERRQLFGETDDLVNLKVKAALNHGLKPILCVGETLEQRESGRAAEVISGQVGSGLAETQSLDISGLIVAYEPVWAIGTGQAATPDIAADIMGGAVADSLRKLYGEAHRNVPLLYGGSVNAGNMAEFAAQPSIHGALVGGASLQADSFIEIARLAGEAKARGA